MKPIGRINIVEKDSRNLVKGKSLRFALDRVQRAWDQGYACAVDMLVRLQLDGLGIEDIIENLQFRVRHPQAVPVLARGTRDDMTPLEKDTVPLDVDAIVTDD